MCSLANDKFYLLQDAGMPYPVPYLHVPSLCKLTASSAPTCASTCRAVESDDPSENDALLSAAEQGQSTHGRFQYFNTFVHAALIVYELGLLDLVSVKYVSATAGCRASQQP